MTGTPPLPQRAVLAVLAATPALADDPAARQDASAVGGPRRTSLDEVSALLEQQRAAWNRGDIAAFCSYYADDCLFLFPTGVTRGRVLVQERYEKKYGAATSSMGHLTWETIDVRAAGDVVPVAMTWRLEWPPSQKKSPSSGSTLIVWHRTSAGWRLVQDASM